MEKGPRFMKRFTIACDFQDRKWPFHIYIGDPALNKHPLENQARWLSRERGGVIPTEVWDSFERMHAIAKEQGISLADLCAYVWEFPNNPVGKTKMAKSSHWQNEVRHLKPSEDLVRPSSDPTSKESTAARHQRKKLVARHDSLRKRTSHETLRAIAEIGRTLWPKDDESSIARLLFMGIGLYLHVIPGMKLTLGEIYRTVSCEDPSYTLAVALDASGRVLSTLAYTLIAQWLNCERSVREKTTLSVTATLLDCAMSSQPKGSLTEDVRKGLLESLLNEPVP